MRALAVLAALTLLLLAVPATVAHAPTQCYPPNPFPSSAGWILQPGESLSYVVPADQFGSLVSSAPVDVTLYAQRTCEIDPACHHHAAIGFLACGTYEQATMEIVNHGPGDAVVLLAIGLCGYGAVC